MVVFGVRFPASHVALLDVIAVGLGARKGARVTRGEALRSIVMPILDTAMRGQAVLRAIAQTQGRIAHVALEGAVAMQGPPEPMLGTASDILIDALDISDAALRRIARKAAKGRGPREPDEEAGTKPAPRKGKGRS